MGVQQRADPTPETRQSEMLEALGRMAAGLTHELNNPSAAVQRAAAQLREHLDELEMLAFKLNRHGLDAQQWSRLETELAKLRERESVRDLGALERADREDMIARWLSSHHVDGAWSLAPTLVEAGVDEAWLEELIHEVPERAIADALTWVGQSQALHDLIDTVAVGAASISELVAAVKEYTHMDRAPEHEIDLHDGIENTLRILGYKLKQGTKLIKQYDEALPAVLAHTGELNQVWTNLLDNAIDAAGPRGEVRVRTYREGQNAVVEIADNGPGIPEEVRTRIFQPFFTTKDVGEGTGLGLALSQRIVVDRCGGTIDFTSTPGDTRFFVRLPLPTKGDQP
jgi:signal transduction histidine kinase